MQVIQQTRTSVNVSGYVDRLEHVKEPVYVQRPIIDDLNSQVIVHDQVEQYV